MPAAIGSYLNLAMESAHCDAVARRHLAPVFNLVGDMKLLFSPSFALRVLASGSARRVRHRLAGAPAIPDEPPGP